MKYIPDLTDIYTIFSFFFVKFNFETGVVPGIVKLFESSLF